jgi:sulfonate transport system permease protein
MRRMYHRALACLLPLSLLAAWSIVHTVHPDAVPLLVAPQALLDVAWSTFTSGDLLTNLIASLQRFILGVLSGGLAGLAFGAFLAVSKTADELLNPGFQAFKHIALFAWIPLLSLWLGMGETAKVAFIGMAAFTPMALNSYEGFRSIPRMWIEITNVLELKPLQSFRRLWVPAAGPSLFAGIHLSVIYAWLATIGAEYFFLVGPGIGHFLIDGRELMRMDWVALGVLLTGGTGAVLSGLIRAGETFFLRWHRLSNSDLNGA